MAHISLDVAATSPLHHCAAQWDKIATLIGDESQEQEKEGAAIGQFWAMRTVLLDFGKALRESPPDNLIAIPWDSWVRLYSFRSTLYRAFEAQAPATYNNVHMIKGEPTFYAGNAERAQTLSTFRHRVERLMEFFEQRRTEPVLKDMQPPHSPGHPKSAYNA